eukprot:COSAG04_NODE_2_length_56781_cov_25.092252_18_plen_1042_part_00
MPRTAGSATIAAAAAARDAAGGAPSPATALEQAMTSLRKRVQVVDDIVAQSPTPSTSSAAARSPAMHTPLSSPVHTPDWGTPMGEQDSRVQTTVLTDEQIAAMVSGGPTPPSSAKKRGLGARLAESLIALSPARATAPAPAPAAAVPSPAEDLRLEKCRTYGLPEASSWNDIADHEQSLSPLSPEELSERRRDAVGKLLQGGDSGSADPGEAGPERRTVEIDHSLRCVSSEWVEPAAASESPPHDAAEADVSAESAERDSPESPAVDAASEHGSSIAATDSQCSEDSFGSVQSGSGLDTSADQPADAGSAQEPDEPAAAEEPPAHEEAEVEPEQQSPGMQAAQFILDGDHAGARLALESVTEPGTADGHDDAQALEDSFAAAEAEARQQTEESFAAKMEALEDSFAAAEAQAAQSEESFAAEEAAAAPAEDAVSTAFGDQFGQLVAEARELMGSTRCADDEEAPAADEANEPTELPAVDVEESQEASEVQAEETIEEEEVAVDESDDAPEGEVPQEPQEPELQVGDRCEVILHGARQYGSVCFIDTAPLLGIGVWVGVAFDAACGKHDGAVQGKRYFQCGARRGMMLKRERVQPSTQPAPAPKPNRFVQRAHEQVDLAAGDSASPLHSAYDGANGSRVEEEEDFSVLVAEARQLAGQVELSDLRRPSMSPAPTAQPRPSPAVSEKQSGRKVRRRSSVDVAAAAAAAAAAAPQDAAEAEAELYLLKRKLKGLWKDMGRQSLRRVLRHACPSGEVQFEDFLRSLRTRGHITDKALSDAELRRLYRGAKRDARQAEADGNADAPAINHHDIRPVPVDSLVQYLGLETTHVAGPSQRRKAPSGKAADAAEPAKSAEDAVDFSDLLREARSHIAELIPIVAHDEPAVATATASAETGTARSTVVAAEVRRAASPEAAAPAPARAAAKRAPVPVSLPARRRSVVADSDDGPIDHSRKVRPAGTVLLSRHVPNRSQQRCCACRDGERCLHPSTALPPGLPLPDAPYPGAPSAHGRRTCAGRPRLAPRAALDRSRGRRQRSRQRTASVS